MCIRTLNYCPPVDITFGESLRAVITADSDLVPDDDRGYRVAFIEAFRRRGIFPPDVRTLSVDSLRWRDPTTEVLEGEEIVDVFTGRLREELRSFVSDWNLSPSRGL